MAQFQEYSDPVTREAVEYILAHAVNRLPVFMAARQYVTRGLFDSQVEYVHGLLWQALVELFDQYNSLPPVELLGTHALTLLKSEPMVGPEIEAEFYQLLNFIDSGFTIESDFQDLAAIDFLQDFLRERMVSNSLKALASNAFGRVPTNLREQLSTLQEKLGNIESLQDVEIQEVIPLQMVTREVQIIPTGVPVIDDRMDGGSCPGETHVILAPTGVGKTMLGVEICGARAKQQLRSDNAKPGSGKISLLYSFEGDSASEEVPLAARMMCYAAEIDKSRVERMRDYSELSRTGNLLEYEQRRFRDRANQDGNILGEYERLMEARQWVNEYVHLADFSMSRRQGRKPRGSGGIAEMEQYADALCSKTKRDIGTIVIDWAGLCVQRKLQCDGVKDITKALSTELMNFVDHVRIHLASRFNCDVWVMHQLNGEANSKSPTTPLHHSMAMWCATFAVPAWYAFVLGVKDKTNSACMLWATKTRRGESKDGTLCFIDGAFGRLVKADNFQVDPVSNRIITAEESARFDTGSTSAAVSPIATIGPTGF